MIPANPRHLVETLWYAHHPATGYPPGVRAVPSPLPGLGFFPGGYGLWGAQPGRPLPPLPIGGVMVLGHDFHSESGYRASALLGGERLSMPTWRNLIRLLHTALIPLESCFFTNVYMGLRVGASATGPFPGATDRGFVEHCKAFLVEQLRMQRPALVLSLGKYVPPVLAQMSPELQGWSAAKGFKDIDARGPVQGGVTFAGLDAHQCTVVALLHPSLRQASLRHRRYEGRGGEEAETQMLLVARRLAGLAGSSDERVAPLTSANLGASTNP